jgi:hypothetical protein
MLPVADIRPDPPFILVAVKPAMNGLRQPGRSFFEVILKGILRSFAASELNARRAMTSGWRFRSLASSQMWQVNGCI